MEGYDLRFARRLVSGVDVWLNNPQYPLEACGTSGMKAAINGIPNLSVLDGWWGEGYDGKNGWAIKPASNTLDDATPVEWYRSGPSYGGKPAKWEAMRVGTRTKRKFSETLGPEIKGFEEKGESDF